MTKIVNDLPNTPNSVHMDTDEDTMVTTRRKYINLLQPTSKIVDFDNGIRPGMFSCGDEVRQDIKGIYKGYCIERHWRKDPKVFSGPADCVAPNGNQGFIALKNEDGHVEGYEQTVACRDCPVVGQCVPSVTLLIEVDGQVCIYAARKSAFTAANNFVNGVVAVGEEMTIASYKLDNKPVYIPTFRVQR